MGEQFLDIGRHPGGSTDYGDSLSGQSHWEKPQPETVTTAGGGGSLQGSPDTRLERIKRGISGTGFDVVDICFVLVKFRSFRSVRAIARPGGVTGPLPRPKPRRADHREKVVKWVESIRCRYVFFLILVISVHEDHCRTGRDEWTPPKAKSRVGEPPKSSQKARSMLSICLCLFF